MHYRGRKRKRRPGKKRRCWKRPRRPTNWHWKSRSFYKLTKSFKSSTRKIYLSLNVSEGHPVGLKIRRGVAVRGVPVPVPLLVAVIPPGPPAGLQLKNVDEVLVFS